MKKYIRKIINHIIDFTRKRKIIEFAVSCGKDSDGDIVHYKGNVYYIHIFNNIIKRI